MTKYEVTYKVNDKLKDGTDYTFCFVLILNDEMFDMNDTVSLINFGNRYVKDAKCELKSIKQIK